MKYKTALNSLITALILCFCAVGSIMAQTRTLSGLVFDSAKEPVIGATVKVKGTALGVTTNINGQFILSDIPQNIEIEISYIGFETKSVQIKGEKTVTIYLEEKNKELQEVVVVGYATQRKADLTGAIGQVDVKDMLKVPVGSFDQAMAGRVAGVNVGTSDGQPGESSSFTIRGGNSLTQSTEPLFVVDGFLMEGFSSAAISNDDISSISILKDASATAIYGARGANGVVVIETKKGFVGKPTISYSGSVGFQDVTKKMELMNAYEFVAYQAELNPTMANSYYLENQGLTLEDYRNAKALNWQDQLFRTALIHKHDLSIRGGSENTKYSATGSFFQQDGIIINSGYDRITGRMTLDQKITSKLSIGAVFSMANTSNHGNPVAQGGGSINSSSGYVLAQTWSFSPANIGNADIDWENQFVDPSAPASHFRVNPIQNTKEVHTKNIYEDLNLRAYISYEIIKGMTLNITGAHNTRKTRNEFFYNSQTLYGTPLNPSNSRGSWGGITHRNLTTWLNENTLKYNTRIAKKHVLNSLVGFTLQGSNNDLYRLEADQIPNEELGMVSLSNGQPYNNQTSAGANRMMSFLARADYSYDQRYLATLTFRADGSSKFPKDNRWSTFPSLGLGWRVSQEAFLKNNKTISNLKLRASYGIIGNNRIGDFTYLSATTINNNYAYSFNNALATPGAVITRMANANLKWENTKQLNIGLDLGLFNSRLNIEADIYRKDTYDLLLNAPIPAHTGYTSSMQNIGEIRNQGLELTITAIPVKTRSFIWESSFNIAFNTNKILSLARGRTELTSAISWDNNYKNPLYIARVGRPAALFYGYIHEGNYQYEDFNEITPGVYQLKETVASNGNNRTAIQPGDIKYRDINGDGIVNASDATIIGDPTPKHFGGFSNQFSYRDFSLSIFFQWSYGNDVFNANRLAFEGNGMNRTNTNQFKSTVNRWTPDNQTNDIPRAKGHAPIGSYDSRTIEDASFLRLKSADLEYRIPKKIATKMSLSSLAFSVTGQNLFTFTSYKGMDPEVSTRHSALTPGFDYAAYPRARTITFGLRATF